MTVELRRVLPSDHDVDWLVPAGSSLASVRSWVERNGVRSVHEPTSRIITVPGLSHEVEILVDTWGVPHIYAASEEDVFLAQGFNAARDRLFHIDLWRRRGLGLLSEVFGAAHVERDRAARLFLYRGDMRAEWLAYGSDTKAVASAFVAGINAFVTLAHEDDSLLPVEFKELGYLPSYWHASDVARIRSHGLFYNLEEEVARALTLRDFGPEVEDLRRAVSHTPTYPSPRDST